MYYGNIKNTDIANGEGVRVTLFVSGCTHHCKNCFNKETWDFCYGKPFTKEVEDELIKMLEPDYIKGLTLLGGEPMEPQNQASLLPFLKRVRETYGNKKNIWCYTGYVLDRDLLKESRAKCEHTEELLKNIDVLVDGPFIESLKNLSLKFRGSSNQRVINLPETLKTNDIVLQMA